MFINDFSNRGLVREDGFSAYCRLEGLDRSFELEQVKQREQNRRENQRAGRRASSPWKLLKRTVMVLR